MSHNIHLHSSLDTPPLLLLLRNSLTTFLAHPLRELSGSLGDLGTLLPLLIALATQSSIRLPATLIASGIAQIATGLTFGVPLPVQPMKALAASALLHNVTPETLAAAGVLVSGACAGLAVSGLLVPVARGIPVPVVKGVQVSAGISLLNTASTKLIGPLPWLDQLDCRVFAMALFTIHLATTRTRLPFALLVTLFATLLALESIPSPPHFSSPFPLPVSLPSFTPTAFSMALSQTPLTLLNSVIAVTSLSASLLPYLPAPSEPALAYSLFFINTLSAPFGAMPVCHGSGGLAAQYRFGARSGASIVLLGLVKLTLGLTMGSSLAMLFAAFPRSILSVTVLAAGLELCRVAASLNEGAPDLCERVGGQVILRAVEEREAAERWTVMLVTAGCGVGFRSDAVGFTMGMLAHLGNKYADNIEELWEEWTHRAGHVLAPERRPLLELIGN